MRYGIFSDIHSNLEALEAVIKAYSAESIDRYIYVGDIVGYGADPRECIREVKEINPAVIVCGNHDWACVGLMDIDYFNPYAKEAVLWTEKALSQEEKEYLKSLGLVYEDDELTVVHGTLEAPEEFNYILSPYMAKPTFECLKTPVCFIGHSHAPIAFTDCEGRIDHSFKSKIEILPNAKQIINVGSVGQPRDGNPKACYAIYDTAISVVEIKRVEYNVEKAQEKIIRAGLPQILAARLSHGR